MMKSRQTFSLFFTLLLTLLLAACTVELAPQTLTAQQTLTRFVPDRGAGSGYRSGDTITFTLDTQVAGYVTLVVSDPDGQAYVLARNLQVYRGQNVIRGIGSNTQFVLVPPTGQHRVRAYFTLEPSRSTLERSRQISALAPANAVDALETHFTLFR